MNSRLYTNTSNVKGVAGLIVTTVLVSYASAHATEIVDKVVNTTKSLTKSAPRKLNQMIHKGKQQYAVIAHDFDGKFYDTGKRIWK